MSKVVFTFKERRPIASGCIDEWEWSAPYATIEIDGATLNVSDVASIRAQESEVYPNGMMTSPGPKIDDVRFIVSKDVAHEVAGALLGFKTITQIAGSECVLNILRVDPKGADHEVTCVGHIKAEERIMGGGERRCEK